MRKNISRIIDAFCTGQSANDKTCSTDGKAIYSYSLPIARRVNKDTVEIMEYDRAPTVTTRSHVAAVRSTFLNSGQKINWVQKVVVR